MDTVKPTHGNANKTFIDETSFIGPIDVNESWPNVQGKYTDLNKMPPMPQSVPDEEPHTSLSDEKSRNPFIMKTTLSIFLNALVVGYFAYATYYFIYTIRELPYQDWPLPLGNTSDNAQCRNPCDTQAPNVDGRCPGNCGMQWCDGYGFLLVMFVITYVIMFYYQIVKRFWGSHLYRTVIAPIVRIVTAWVRPIWTKRIISCVILCLLLAIVVFDSLESPERLQSLSGIVVLYAIGFAFSKNRSRINYQPVVLGFVFQFLLGLLSIRWEVGRNILRCIGKKVTHFLRYADEGSKFVYGDYLVQSNVFVFSVMPITFFFSLFISILYYYGVIQIIVEKLGWMLQSVLDTTVCESVTSAVNVFLGMSESILLIRPYLPYLTASEMHAVMTTGLATVAGSVMAAYVAYGAEPAHLVTSSIMSAPASLGFAKLFYPETEESKTRSENLVLAQSKDTSVLDAASNGASLAIEIVLGVTANLVAFIAFMAFLNGSVNFFGHLIGFDITFEVILAKLFIPLAWIIGIPWNDCEQVAKVIATKSLVNEFVAYQRLGVMKKENLISLRSSAIATYAICGFANPSSVGILIAALSAMAPDRRSTITSVAFRSYICGSIICFMTASIAGLLMTVDISSEISRQYVNSTVNVQ